VLVLSGSETSKTYQAGIRLMAYISNVYPIFDIYEMLNNAKGRVTHGIKEAISIINFLPPSKLLVAVLDKLNSVSFELDLCKIYLSPLPKLEL